MARLLLVVLLFMLGMPDVSSVTQQVSDFAGLQSAVADTSVEILEVMQAITFTSRITIDRAVTVRGTGCNSDDTTCTVTLDGDSSQQLFLVSVIGEVVFENLRFENGYTSGWGGAVLVSSSDSSSKNVNFTSCNFNSNVATGWGGGAVALNVNTIASFTGCTFTSNTATVRAACANNPGWR